MIEIFDDLSLDGCRLNVSASLAPGSSRKMVGDADCGRVDVIGNKNIIAFIAFRIPTQLGVLASRLKIRRENLPTSGFEE